MRGSHRGRTLRHAAEKHLRDVRQGRRGRLHDDDHHPLLAAALMLLARVPQHAVRRHKRHPHAVCARGPASAVNHGEQLPQPGRVAPEHGAGLEGEDIDGCACHRANASKGRRRHAVASEVGHVPRCATKASHGRRVRPACDVPERRFLKAKHEGDGAGAGLLGDRLTHLLRRRLRCAALLCCAICGESSLDFFPGPPGGGPLLVVCQWLDQDIDVHTQDPDATPFLDAAGRGQPAWPSA